MTPRLEAEASRPPRGGRVLALLLWAVVGLPAAALAGMLPAAALRGALGLPMAAATVVGVAMTLTGAVALATRCLRRGGVDPAWALPALAGALVLPARLLALLAASAPEGLVTIGGGDFGNHLWIAAQLADRMPGVYLGFTGWHMTLWAVSHGLGLPTLDAAAIAIHAPSAVAWALLAVAAARAASLGQSGRAASAASIVAMFALSLAAERFGFAMTHYLAAEGFVGQLHALLPWSLALLGLASAATPLQLLGAAGLAVLAMRYSYGIDLPALLLGLGALALGASRTAAPWAALPWLRLWRRWPQQPPPVWPLLWRHGLRGLALLCLLQVALLAATLALSWAKEGSVLHPTPHGRLLALGLGGGGAALLAWQQPRARRLAAWLLTLLGAGGLLVLLHLLHPTWPRAYYLFKHGMLLEIIGLWAIAAAAGAAAGVFAAAAGAAGVAPPRTLARTPIWLPALAALALAITAPARIARSNPVLMLGYHERAGDQPWSQVSPLVDHSLLQLADALRAEGWRVVGAQHPHWPVHNAMTSALLGWAPIAPALEIGLQEQRWIRFLHGDVPPPGACYVVAAGPHVDAAWRRHAKDHGGLAGPRLRAALPATARCLEGPPMVAGAAATRACALCTSPRPAP